MSSASHTNDDLRDNLHLATRVSRAYRRWLQRRHDARVQRLARASWAVLVRNGQLTMARDVIELERVLPCTTEYWGPHHCWACGYTEFTPHTHRMSTRCAWELLIDERQRRRAGVGLVPW